MDLELQRVDKFSHHLVLGHELVVFIFKYAQAVEFFFLLQDQSRKFFDIIMVSDEFNPAESLFDLVHIVGKVRVGGDEFSGLLVDDLADFSHVLRILVRTWLAKFAVSLLAEANDLFGLVELVLLDQGLLPRQLLAETGTAELAEEVGSPGYFLYGFTVHCLQLNFAHLVLVLNFFDVVQEAEVGVADLVAVLDA